MNVFIAPSRLLKDIHHRMGLDIPIIHLPSFIPPVEAVSTDHVLEEPYFLFIGRLEKIKGLQSLFPIFRHYGKAQLLIAGTGNYESNLRKLAEGNNNIHFLGHLPEQQLHALYRQAVALIVPSICFESLALVIIEAFGQKTPAIVRNMGGMPKLIKESGGGLIYNTREELVAQMERLLTDQSYRCELGRGGYETYQRNWTDEVHLKRYFTLISEIATARSQTLD